MKTCQACGADMRAEASFCALCGASAAPVSATTGSRGWLAPLMVGIAGGIAVGVLLTWFLLRDDGEPSTADATVEDVAESLVGQLGTEDEAVRATFRALDRGYSYAQLAAAAEDGTLEPDGSLLDSDGQAVAPESPPEEPRYAATPSRVPLMVRAGAPALPASPTISQETDLLDDDVAALGRMVAQFNGDPRKEFERNLGALDLLLELARSGYNGAEIFGILANPHQRFIFHQGRFYGIGVVGSDGKLPANHIECPESLTRDECGRVLDGTRRVLEPNAVRDYFPGYDPDAVGSTSETSATAPPGATQRPDEEAAIYAGQVDVNVCRNTAANRDTTSSIEATVTGDVIELAYELTCYEQPWVSDATTGAVTCGYTLTVVASATGTVSASGEFSGSGMAEQSTADFEGPRCQEFPYDGSNDITEEFAISGTISESQISAAFYEEDSPDVPPLPFTLTRQ